MGRPAELIILGCGGSGGTPLAGGYWGNCNPSNPKNHRSRASVALKTEDKCIVIDSGPDFRDQTIREGLGEIDAVLYTHDHADHVNGMDDVRYVTIKRRRETDDENYQTPIYFPKHTWESVKERFSYLFQVSQDGLYVPLMDVHLLDDFDTKSVHGIDVGCAPQTHGRILSAAYKFGNIAYSTDVSDMTEDTLQALKGIDIWVVDCGQFGSDFITVHPNFERVLEWNELVGAKKLYLTHLTPRIDYDDINAKTPDYVEACYDGLRIKCEV